MFVKAGCVWVNLSLVTMVREVADRDDGPTGDLLVYFHRDKRARVRGAEAMSLRDFLDANSAGAGGHPAEATIDSGRP